ncbi:TonB-dependent receptor domain-containing protein [Pirellulimonas nuda]|uniref:TonB-dependent receptor domain-containing protein n=1 Tax=Pirellulimonas nuda TaxID=2528009 RepID=UPI0011A3714C|nr:TonB-dependent receptor [Pirellulimonas nuda]
MLPIFVLASVNAASGHDGYASYGDVVWASDRAEQAQFQAPLLPQADLGIVPQAPQASSAQLRLASVEGLTPLGVNFATAGDAKFRGATDAGDLLGLAPGVVNLGVQHRNPIVTDPRVRGSRVGALAASGSYWVPARIDLDTAVSKIDSRWIDDVLVVAGPYSALHGPGFEFVDIELAKAPRYSGGYESHGVTGLDYKANGQQWHGRQAFEGGSDVWGFRVGYNHRTGSDYTTGNGEQVAASYNARSWNVALGANLTESTTVDLHLLRLDQTDVELPGQAFDISYLVTDGYEVGLVLEDRPRADRLLVEAWYNRTRFDGNAQNPSKRAQFPYLDFIEFVGFTNVDSMSTGYRAAGVWDGEEGETLTLGADLRYIRQELNEITSGQQGFFAWDDANSPIPRSDSANPGLFAEYAAHSESGTRVKLGGRLDLVAMDVLADAASLANVGIVQTSAAAILGTSDFDQDELLGLCYLAVDQELGDGFWVGSSVGYAERAPNLTERYAIEPFMFLLQNGLNTVTGNPLLDKERRLQVDLRASKQAEFVRGDVTLFHAWAWDYITFQALSTVTGPPQGDIQQVNLNYVNTKLATLWGAEARGECDLTGTCTGFSTLRYVEGTDQNRDGSYATRQATATTPSENFAGLSRGFFSGLTGDDNEPLPGILPFESRIGLRLHEADPAPWWLVEVSARLVDAQHRVARSLLESTTPAFVTFDLRSSWRPRERVVLVAGVENFTDRNYREALDFRSTGGGPSVFRPGVTAYVGGELAY